LESKVKAIIIRDAIFVKPVVVPRLWLEIDTASDYEHILSDLKIGIIENYFSSSI
jgi:hypothetical protein